MEYKRIEELTSVVTGGTPSTSKAEYWDEGDIPWLQSGCCQNCDVYEAEKYITQIGYDNSSTRMMPVDTVMIALTGATAGKIGYLNFEACGNQSITGILPCDELNQRYLYFYLISQRNKILADCIGGAQPHISQGYVKNMRVPVPTKEEQQSIVEKLKGLTAIISQRQNEIELLDDSQVQICV
ncbi:restriction endonuclease subunit S [Eubacterium pyruvativorans]|uniref:restriction endonuclease subunit S n=1 Tax=Eubacterium pyruvativorans TaxID=155865 RepID=UPI003F8B815C